MSIHIQQTVLQELIDIYNYIPYIALANILCDVPHWLGREQNTIYKGCGNPHFKALKGSPKGKAQRGQYLLEVDLDRYKWNQSQTRGDVPVRTLGPEGGGFGGDPTLIGGRKECQRGHWAPRRGGLWCPTLVGEENKTPFIKVWKPYAF